MKEEHNASYDHVLGYTWIFGGVQGLIILINLVRNKFMALLIGAGGIGFNSLLISVQNFASQCTNLGISFGAVPKLSDYYEQERQNELTNYIQVIRLWSLIASLLGFLFCVIISPLVNSYSFTWGNHTLHYAMLGLSVAMLAITGGETAILKATRRLKALACVQVYTAIISLFISIPIYYFFHDSGILPVIVLIAAMSMLTTIFYSYRFYPLHFHFNPHQMKEGADMIVLGMAFILAAAIGTGAEMAIRAFLNVEGGLYEVGLYNIGYLLTITYAGLVFTSMETDYFPRLSAISKNVAKTNEMVNKQMEVSLMLLSPLLVMLLTALPVLVPLLFSEEFLPVVAMAQVAVLAMYFKVLSLPIAYITLARRYSLTYLFFESSYFIVLVIAIVIGFRNWGIWGTGIALVVAHVAELLIVGSYSYCHYDYRCTCAIAQYAVIQMLIGFVSYIVSCMTDGWLYWITEAALIIISTAYSIHILRQKTHLWEALKGKLRI